MTRAPRSLAVRLTTAVVGVLGLSLCVFSVILESTFGRALWQQFDERLAEDGRAVANMIEERIAEPWEIEAGALGEFDQKRGGAYFEVWMDDGSVLARSPSLAARDLAPPSQPPAPVIRTVELPDGRSGRLFLASLLPRADEEGPSQPSGRHMTVAIARATDEIDVTLATLRLLLLASGLCAMALAAVAAIFAIRSGMVPIARLVARVDAIDARRLGDRLPLDDLPRELQPIATKLNELLARLEASFARERRFSADLGHELRTPLAGLRSILEVASSRERSPRDYHGAMRDALGVVDKMSGLAENLLMLARLDARQVRVAKEEIALRQLVDECFAPHAEKARQRRLRFENRVPLDAFVISDRDKLRIVAANLLANAIDYTHAEGLVIAASNMARGELLDISDSGPPLPERALDKIFDRFFRLDTSRSETGAHCGIGLALVRALCDALALSVTAENRADGSVAFLVRDVGSLASIAGNAVSETA